MIKKVFKFYKCVVVGGLDVKIVGISSENRNEMGFGSLQILVLFQIEFSLFPIMMLIFSTESKPVGKVNLYQESYLTRFCSMLKKDSKIRSHKATRREDTNNLET